MNLEQFLLMQISKASSNLANVSTEVHLLNIDKRIEFESLSNKEKLTNAMIESMAINKLWDFFNGDDGLKFSSGEVNAVINIRRQAYKSKNNKVLDKKGLDDFLSLFEKAAPPLG